MATIGRLMKNLAMLQAYFDAPVSDGALDASRTFWPARTRSAPSTITRSPGLSPSAHVNGLVRPDHRDLMDSLQVLDGPLGDHERTLLDLDDGTHLGVLAGAEHVSRIREDATREHGAGGHVDLSIEGGCPPLRGIDASVR